MNTGFNPFYTPLGKIRPNGNSIEYHIYPKVQWVVKNQGQPDVKWFSQVANRWGINEYSLNERDIVRFKTAIEEQAVVKQQQQQFYLEINKPLTNVNRVDFPKSIAFTIYQHEYGITTAKSRMPIIGAYGAGPCVIFALYDDESKIAALAHIDGYTEVQSLSNLIRNFKIESTVAHLYGGDECSFDECLDVIEFIKSSGIKIENCALIEHSNGNVSLAIDARNGKLYSSVEPHHLTPHEQQSKKEQLVAMGIPLGPSPLDQGYDGLADLGEINLEKENVILSVSQSTNMSRSIRSMNIEYTFNMEEVVALWCEQLRIATIERINVSGNNTDNVEQKSSNDDNDFEVD